ncbi:MAG: hypothetical protein J6M53_08385 [Bacteroidaceae bacterium]|nr:hypothetical protein [Bacteroidaceae bacterium]
MLFALNLVYIGYYQSIEKPRRATLYMLLRGLIVVVPTFILLPSILGDVGLWLAVPASELITFLVIVARQRGELG